MQFFVNGAKFAISTALAAAVPITALSNANPAVATGAAPADGSILVLKSGWPELNDTVARSDNAAGGTFELEGTDTADLVRYPAGEGVGSYAIASSFVSLSQVREFSTNGGEQQYFQYQYIEDQGGRQRQSPTFKNALVLDMVLDYDPDLAWYAALVEADRKREPVVLRETLPNGDVLYFYGLIAFNKVPTQTVNENMTVLASFSLNCDPIRYAGA